MNPPQIDLRHTALVLIDLQKGIVGMPVAPHASVDVISNAVKIIARFREAGALVVPVRVSFAADWADAVKVPVDQSINRAFPEGWDELVPELGVKPGDLLITKKNWGAFYGTDLDLQLRRRGINTIVLGGIATNMGVESTARNAHELGYAQIFIEDAMSSSSAEAHQFAVKNILPRLGLVRSTEEVLAGCSASAK